jgi:precorrin-6B methylase 2
MTDRAGFPISPGALSAAKIRLCVGKDDPIIVEVGANNGQTTVEILRAMPRATIYAFEPEPRAIAKFRAATVNTNTSTPESRSGRGSSCGLLCRCALTGHRVPVTLRI